MKRALEITTTTHAVAVSVYILQAVMGVAYLLTFPVAPSLTTAAGPMLGSLWALVLTIAAFACTYAAFSARKFLTPALTVEQWGCTTITFTSVAYIWGIFAAGNAGKSFTTIGFTLMVGVGCAVRCIQIIHERRKIRDAQNETVTTRVVADPDGE